MSHTDAGGPLRRQAPRTRPLTAKPTNGRPMSRKTSGHGFVSKAENTEMVAYSTNKKANQQISATLKPATAFAALTRLINHASVSFPKIDAIIAVKLADKL